MSQAKCSTENCPQPVFKNGVCIDHSITKEGVIEHKHLNTFGKAKLNVEQECDRINQQFLNDKNYECDINVLNEYKVKFREMDENGSGDIDINELGRAMERLKKPKNQLQLRKMIEEVDIDQDGCINYNEFLIMMLGKKSSVLQLILKYEAMNKPKETPSGPPPKKNLADLIKK